VKISITNFNRATVANIITDKVRVNRTLASAVGEILFIKIHARYMAALSDHLGHHLRYSTSSTSNVKALHSFLDSCSYKSPPSQWFKEGRLDFQPSDFVIEVPQNIAIIHVLCRLARLERSISLCPPSLHSRI